MLKIGAWYFVGRTVRRDLARAVALAHWAADGSSTLTSVLVSSAFFRLCHGDDGDGDDKREVKRSVLAGPALGLLVSTLSPTLAPGVLAPMLAMWPRTPEGNALLANCVENMAAWPLGLEEAPSGLSPSPGDPGKASYEFDDDTSHVEQQPHDVLNVGFIEDWVAAFLTAIAQAQLSAAVLAAVPRAALAAARQLLLPEPSAQPNGTSAIAVAAALPVDSSEVAMSECSVSANAGEIPGDVVRKSPSMESPSSFNTGAACMPALRLLARLLHGYRHAPDAFLGVAPLLTQAAQRLAPPPRNLPCSSETRHDTSSGTTSEVLVEKPSTVTSNDYTIVSPSVGAPDASRGGTDDAAQGIEIIGNCQASSSVMAPELAALADLCHTQMAMHPGHPDVYEPLLAVLPPPAEPSEVLLARAVATTIAWINNDSALAVVRAGSENLNTGSMSSGSFSSGSGSSAHGPQLLLSTQRPPGPQVRGLVNLGNTCYLNSALQCLVANADFRTLLLAEEDTPAPVKVSPASSKRPIQKDTSMPTDSAALPRWDKTNGLVLELRRALAVLGADRLAVPTSDVSSVATSVGTVPVPGSDALSGHKRPGASFSLRKTLMPRALHSSLPPPFNSFAQQDATEVLRFLLDAVENAQVKSDSKANAGENEQRSESEKANVKKTNTNDCTVASVFGGFLETRTKCLVCGSESVVPEPFTDLALPLPDHSTIDARNHGSDSSSSSSNENIGCSMFSVPELLDSWLQPERLEGENAYACSVCASAGAAKYEAELKTAVTASEMEAKGALLPDNTATTPICSPGRSPAERRTVLMRAPKHLVVSLGRFGYDPTLGQRTKRLDAVRFQTSLTLPLGDSSDENALETTQSSSVALEDGCTDECSKADSVLQDEGIEASADKEFNKSATRSRKRGLPGVSIPSTDEINGASGEVYGSLPEHYDQIGSNRPSDTSQLHSAEYALYGVVVHCGGSAQAGHYYALARDSTAAQAHEIVEAGATSAAGTAPTSGNRHTTSSCNCNELKWQLYNDATVSLSSESALNRLASAAPGATDTPYLLFYRRVDDFHHNRSSVSSASNELDVKSSADSSKVDFHSDSSITSAPAAVGGRESGALVAPTAVYLAADLSAFLASDNAAAVRQAASITANSAPGASNQPPQPPPPPPRGGSSSSGFGFGLSEFGGGGFGGMGGGGGPIC